MVRVAILDRHEQPVSGFAAEECVAITTDSTRAPIRWRNKVDLSTLHGKTIRLRFYIINASLYSFTIENNTAS
jgi:hypothetical protein